MAVAEDRCPNRYVRARDVVTPVVQRPPDANDVWIFGVGADDLITHGWAVRTTINDAALRRCDPDERLLLEACDER